MRFHSRPFRPKDQERVHALVLEGLAEHWSVLDPTANPDPEDVAAAYRQGCFLVVWQDGEIVGTGAFLPRESTSWKSCGARYAGSGADEASARPSCTLYARRPNAVVPVSSTATWHDAIAFNRALGFKETHHADGNMYFALPVNACTRWD